MTPLATNETPRGRILVVDDEQAIRLALDRALRAAGYEVAVAVNGEDALGQLAAGNWDLMLLDMRMPGIDGLEVLGRLREGQSDLPVVMITAYGSVPTAVEAMKLGAVDYLEKPFTNQQILALIERISKRRELDEQRAGDDPAAILELAKGRLQACDFAAAEGALRRLIARDPSLPEPFNLLGVLHEMRGEILAAQKMYRAALSLDPSYQAADHNLTRTVQGRDTKPDLGGDEPKG